MPEPTVVQQQVQDVQAAEQYFSPAKGLPVSIDFTNPTDPYELSQQVVYDNGIVRVEMEQGFRWDGASIPVWWPIILWVASLTLLYLYPEPWLLVTLAGMILYTLRVLPYMQKMGLHSRAACVHDKLCRAQKVPRVVADAVLDAIMQSDQVPWDIRFWIYSQVRLFGWIQWRRNRRALRAKAEAGRDVKVSPSSLDAKKNG